LDPILGTRFVKVSNRNKIDEHTSVNEKIDLESIPDILTIHHLLQSIDD